MLWLEKPARLFDGGIYRFPPACHRAAPAHEHLGFERLDAVQRLLAGQRLTTSGTYVTLDDVGNASAFLCSDLAAGITGQVLYVDAGFNIAGMPASQAGTMLDVDYNVICRTGLHCAPLVHEQIETTAIHGAVRFGVGPFNTESDIDRAVEAVKEIAANREAFAGPR